MPYKDIIIQKQAQHESYLRHIDKIKKNNRDRKQEKKKWFRDIVNQYRCVRCQESDSYCLDFHHINPKTKKQGVSWMVNQNCSKENILQEIKKCIVFCSNCHRKYHAGRFLIKEEWLKSVMLGS